MACKIIPDGYTQSDTCLGASPVFRPMPFGDYDDYMSAVIAAPEKEKKALIGQLMCDRIVSWDVVDENDRVLPITPENFNAMPAAAGQRLRNLITGQVAPDNGKAQGDNEGNSEAA